MLIWVQYPFFTIPGMPMFISCTANTGRFNNNIVDNSS